MIKRTLLFFMLTLNLLVLCSCFSKKVEDNNIYSEHLIFQQRKNGYYQVVGLTEDGKQSKTLVFPSYYDGIAVNGIGIVSYGLYHSESIDRKGFVYIPNRLDVSNVENIYIASNYTNDFVFEGYSNNLKKCVYLSHIQFCNNNNSYLKSYIEDIKISFSYVDLDYVNVFCLEEYNFLKGLYPYYFDVENNIVVANIEFYYNNDPAKQRLYWIDYEKDEKLIFEPPVPNCDGREFIGWYTEPECINKWDFNEDMIEKSADLNNMVQLKLYAKWK